MPSETMKMERRKHAAPFRNPVLAIEQPPETFLLEAECCLLTLKEHLARLGHDEHSAMLRLIDRTLAKRPVRHSK